MSGFLIRVTSPSGLARIELPPDATVASLHEKIFQACGIAKDNLRLSFDGRNWSVFALALPLANIPEFRQEGVRLTVQPVNSQTAQPASATHSQSQAAKSTADLSQVPAAKEVTQPRACAHGPNQKCLKCIELPQKTSEVVEKPTGSCAHGPGVKCVNCLNVDQGVKHLAFDEFIGRNYAKCRNHAPGQKCTNCLIDLKFDYKPKPCRNHEPYPRGMCSSCMPPAIAVKRQPYRHVDYAQFNNSPEVQQLIQYWLKSQKQRVAHLFGYYAEDPVYERGVRAVVEAVYEPPQTNDISFSVLQQDPFAGYVEKIAGALGLERLGWLFTTQARDVFLSADEMIAAAQQQEQHSVRHPCGLDVSKQITVVFRSDEKGAVAPEVYMISDQGQRLVADQIIERAESRKFLKIRAAEKTGYAPRFLYMGKDVDQVEPDFFIVNVAQGQPLSAQYNVLRSYDFPAANRADPQRVENLRDYLRRHRSVGPGKYCNFQFLLYLAKALDLPTVLKIAEALRDGKEIPSIIEQMITQRFA